jgi:hypothetical protein
MPAQPERSGRFSGLRKRTLESGTVNPRGAQLSPSRLCIAPLDSILVNLSPQRPALCQPDQPAAPLAPAPRPLSRAIKGSTSVTSIFVPDPFITNRQPGQPSIAPRHPSLPAKTGSDASCGGVIGIEMALHHGIRSVLTLKDDREYGLIGSARCRLFLVGRQDGRRTFRDPDSCDRGQWPRWREHRA